MDPILLGIFCGLGFGIFDILIMIPLQYENRRKMTEAMSAAFIERFMLGLLIPTTTLGVHPVITGAFLGLTLSVPAAIITRTYIPIISIGIIGGLIIGYITSIVI